MSKSHRLWNIAGLAFVVWGAFGLATLHGQDQPSSAPAAINYEPDAISGRVLPFKVLRAVRNYAYSGGMVGAQVAVAVPAGSARGDWYATAVYVAQKALVKDATFVQAEVYLENPWGDMPPTEHKLLATAYYSPKPGLSPWSNEWGLIGANRSGTLADVEFDVLINDWLEKNGDRISDPDKRMEKAKAYAKTSVMKKYRLSATWTPTLTLLETERPRGYVHVQDTVEGEISSTDLVQCLTKPSGIGPLRGCLPGQDQ